MDRKPAEHAALAETTADGDDANAATTAAPLGSAAPGTFPSIPQRYRRLKEVGRGGLGRVLAARDLLLDREVAMKELLANDAVTQRRFVREAMITARLQHPSIVPIYDAGAGDADGPYYAMKLVAGRSLAEVLAERTTLAERLALLPSAIAVADAMAYAHSERIIHRDLKPQNVLVGEFGETVVIDWGLAKDLAAGERDDASPYRASPATSTETVAGSMLGTPAYMAPEQAVGEPLDERADVYAIGAILYHLVAGTAPHEGKTLDGMLSQILGGKIRPLAERVPDAPPDLVAIVRKAMARERSDRYASARELAEDLHRFQTGKLVGARTYSRAERLARWVRRHRTVVVVSAIATAILVGYGAWSVSRIVDERASARREADRATLAAREAEHQRDAATTRALLVRARQYAATGHTAEEIAVLRLLARPDADASSRQLAIDAGLIWKAHQRLARAFGADAGTVHRAADGSRVVAAVPGAIVAWDTATGAEIARMAIPRQDDETSFLRLAGISPNGRYVFRAECVKPGPECHYDIVGRSRIAMRADARLRLYELASGKIVREWVGSYTPRLVEIAPDDTAIVERRGDRLEWIVAPVAASPVDATGCEHRFAVAPGGRTLALECGGELFVVGGDGVRRPLTLSRAGEAYRTLNFIAADRLVALSSISNQIAIQLWDTTTGHYRASGDLLVEGPRPPERRKDIAWSVFDPPTRGMQGRRWSPPAPRIRIGNTQVMPPLRSVVAPSPRLVPGGALVEYGGASLSIAHDDARGAALFSTVPRTHATPCLDLGQAEHAIEPLDGGARILVDEQELPADLAMIPDEGFLSTTTSELPVRQLRPLQNVSREHCLHWARTSTGARHGPILHVARPANVVVDPTGNLVLDPGVISADGRHVVTFEHRTGRVEIRTTSDDRVVRAWDVPVDIELQRSNTVAWKSLGLVVVAGSPKHLVPVDPALPIRDGDLVGDSRSPYAVREEADGIVVVNALDGREVARHRGASEPELLPDASGRVLARRGDTLHLFPLSGTPLALDPIVSWKTITATQAYLVTTSPSDAVTVLSLVTGKYVDIYPVNAAVPVNDELWAIHGDRNPELVRRGPDGAVRGKRALATTDLPFHHVARDLAVSPDGKRLVATYAVTELRFARAMWDVESGALLWVGPLTSRVVGDWIVGGHVAYRPRFEVDVILADTGARTNFRVCEGDLRVVAVEPPPAPETYWAPASACATGKR